MEELKLSLKKATKLVTRTKENKEKCMENSVTNKIRIINTKNYISMIFQITFSKAIP